MINRILSFLLGGTAEPRPLPQADSQHLLGALLVRMAYADGSLKVEELQVMDRLFADRFGLNAIEAAKMRADCTRLADALPETEFLGPLISAKIPHDQRFALREALRQVAVADGKLDPKEIAMIGSVTMILQDAV